MTEPDLFKEAQEQDKDGIVVPILQRMLEHPDFADAACLLRGMISGMQWRIADLQERAETERDARQEAHEATKYWEDRALKAETQLANANLEWQRVVIDALIVNHIYVKEHDTDPRKALADLIAYETKIALDPAVSSDAQALINSAGAKALFVFKGSVRILKNVADEKPDALVECVQELAKAFDIE